MRRWKGWFSKSKLLRGPWIQRSQPSPTLCQRSLIPVPNHQQLWNLWKGHRHQVSHQHQLWVLDVWVLYPFSRLRKLAVFHSFKIRVKEYHQSRATVVGMNMFYQTSFLVPHCTEMNCIRLLMGQFWFLLLLPVTLSVTHGSPSSCNFLFEGISIEIQPGTHSWSPMWKDFVICFIVKFPVHFTQRLNNT